MVSGSAHQLPFWILQLSTGHRVLGDLERGGFARPGFRLYLFHEAGLRPLASTLEARNRSRALPTLMRRCFLWRFADIW